MYLHVYIYTIYIYILYIYIYTYISIYIYINIQNQILCKRSKAQNLPKKKEHLEISNGEALRGDPFRIL